MRLSLQLVLRLLVAIPALLSGCGRTAPDRIQSSSQLVVQDVSVFNGERVMEHRTVLGQDGVISQVAGSELNIPPVSEIIDGRGRTLLPGFIDAHVHLSDNTEADLRQALSMGVTTVIDMFNASTRLEHIKALRSADRLELADVRTAGVGASAPGGHP